MEGDNDMFLGVVILAVLIIIIFIMPKSAGNPDSSSTSNSGAESDTALISPKVRDISLGTGNASYAYQPYEEYITLYNRESKPVDITNWKLKNGKDKRAYDLGGDLRRFPADTAVIGQATLFVSPAGANTFQHIILQDGEMAIVTTGAIGNQSPYKIVSFKENICSGYLEDLSEYEFNPPLTRDCPRPADEPGVNMLDAECRKFIESMSSCRTPEFNTRDTEGEICYNCVDRQSLSSSCVAFIKNHFNYTSCIANHKNDEDFPSRTWRVFLNHGWEMWAKDYETIELFDQFGRLVDEYSY